eukprot:333213-Chlamydomonas_euryale.AAC.1
MPALEPVKEPTSREHPATAGPASDSPVHVGCGRRRGRRGEEVAGRAGGRRRDGWMPSTVLVESMCMEKGAPGAGARGGGGAPEVETLSLKVCAWRRARALSRARLGALRVCGTAVQFGKVFCFWVGAHKARALAPNTHPRHSRRRMLASLPCPSFFLAESASLETSTQSTVLTRSA